MHRYRELLMSCLASAMFTSVFFRAPGAVTAAAVVDPSPAHRAIDAALKSGPLNGWQAVPWRFDESASPLVLVAVPAKNSAAQHISLEKLRQLIDITLTNPETRVLPQPLTEALGLTHPFTRRTATYKNPAGVHGFSAGVSQPDRVIFYLAAGDSVWVYAATSQGELVGAATRINGVIAAAPLAAAKAGFEAELRVWNAAQLPDPHIPSNS